MFRGAAAFGDHRLFLPEPARERRPGADSLGPAACSNTPTSPNTRSWAGGFRADTSALYLDRDSGTDMLRGSVDADWRRPFTTEDGQLITFEAFAARRSCITSMTRRSTCRARQRTPRPSAARSAMAWWNGAGHSSATTNIPRHHAGRRADRPDDRRVRRRQSARSAQRRQHRLRIRHYQSLQPQSVTGPRSVDGRPALECRRSGDRAAAQWLG